MPDDRFYIDQGFYETDNVDGWFRVIDEDAGGVIAYFGEEQDAINFRNLKREETGADTHWTGLDQEKFRAYFFEHAMHNTQEEWDRLLDRWQEEQGVSNV